MGLHNLRQRVAAFQGKVSIYSSDNGTEINVELKLKNDNSHDKSSHS
jgi:signal transduction histidine kinase